MFNRHRRVLWLLNHRTLMPAEVPLMEQLGFEVFVPKVIPATNFQSAAISYDWDANLTVPPRALKRLNEFNFYTDRWPADIIEIVNRYFGMVFGIPHGVCIEQAIRHVEGVVVLRAFGLNGDRTYSGLGELGNSDWMLRSEALIGDRFRFAQAYRNLAEIEAPYIADRAVHLPIAMPDDLLRPSTTWTGGDARMLFVGTNLMGWDKGIEAYKLLKERFGDLPYVIMGKQDIPLDDPQAAGLVSDEERARLYAECAVMFYPFREPRHVHYVPFEAAATGMPVAYFADSLLGDLTGDAPLGRARTIEDMRTFVERCLTGDPGFLEEVRLSQSDFSNELTMETAAELWNRNLDASGIRAQLTPEPRGKVVAREIGRTLGRPWLGGHTRAFVASQSTTDPAAGLSAADSVQVYGASLYGGIDFSQTELPSFVHYVNAIQIAEHRWRWTTEQATRIVLRHTLSGTVVLRLTAAVPHEFDGQEAILRISGQSFPLALRSDLDQPTPQGLIVHLDEPTNVIEIEAPGLMAIDAPFPYIDGLGIALFSLSAEEPKVIGDLELELGEQAFPDAILGVTGLDSAEGWGRWSVGPKVRLRFAGELTGRIRLRMRAAGLGSNADVPVPITIGDQTVTVTLGAGFEDREMEFDLRTPATDLEISVPAPAPTQDDPRHLGIALASLAIARA